MTVDQIEMACRTKENVVANASIRYRLEHEICDLFNCLLNIYGGRTPLSPAQLLEDDNMIQIAMGAESFRDFSELIMTLLNRSAGKMAVYHTPRQLRETVSIISVAPDVYPTGALDRVESGLVTLCRNLREMVDRENAFEPLTYLGFMLDRPKQELETRFIDYDHTFEELWQIETTERPHHLADGQTLHHAFGDLTNTLWELFPHFWGTLELYCNLRERYGDNAFRDRPEIVVRRPS